MNVEANDIIKGLPEYLFAEIDRKKKELMDKGVDIISFGVGDPDMPTPKFIVSEMKKALDNPANHQYPFGAGTKDFRTAACSWLKRRFNLDLDVDKEICALIGSKEGIGHLPLAFLNVGDIVLCPEPGYPVYSSGTKFAKGEPYFLPLLEENGFRPNLKSIPANVLKKAKILFLNSPNNPTAAVYDEEYFKEVVEFAKNNDIIVAHDAAYSEIYYDNKKPVSFLNVSGAREVGVEYHSLSKTYNMTGWRIGFVVGNSEIIAALKLAKDNYDSGAFTAVQVAGIAALNNGELEVEKLRKMYQERRDVLVDGLRNLGLSAMSPEASFYVWTKVPPKFSSSTLAKELLENAGIVVTPGNGFGESGEGYIRFALTVNIDRIKEALARMKKINVF